MITFEITIIIDPGGFVCPIGLRSYTFFASKYEKLVRYVSLRPRRLDYNNYKIDRGA
jgi:hypothetical protein